MLGVRGLCFRRLVSANFIFGCCYERNKSVGTHRREDNSITHQFILIINSLHEWLRYAILESETCRRGQHDHCLILVRVLWISLLLATVCPKPRGTIQSTNSILQSDVYNRTLRYSQWIPCIFSKQKHDHRLKRNPLW